MIQTLTIDNYRGLTHLELTGLGRVNLLVGRNNVGKTSILEALYFLCEVGCSEALTSIMRRRKLPDPSHRDLYELLRGNDVTAPVHVVAGDGASTWTLAYKRVSHPGEPDSSITHVKPDFTQAEGKIASQGAWGSRSLDRPQAVWFDFAATTDLDVAKRLGTIRRKNRMPALVAHVQKIDERVEDFSQIEDEGSPHMEAFVRLRGLQEWIRLTQAGHGLRYATALFTELDGLRNAIVLIDEIEVGLHYDALATVWKTILTIAQANNLQIFATTHSYECIQAADTAFAEDPDALKLIRIQNVQGALKAIEYPAGVRHGALQDGMEVR